MFKFKKKTPEETKKDIYMYAIAVLVLAALILLIRPIKTYSDPSIWDNVTQSVKNLWGETDEIKDDAIGILTSDDPGVYIIDEILLDLAVRVYEVGISVLDLVVKLICTSFEPSLNPLIAIENGNNLSANAALGLVDTSLTEAEEVILGDGKVGFEDSKTLMAIWKFAFPFSIVTATLIALFNLILCIAGKSSEIKDTPAMITGKYLLSLVLIFASKEIIAVFINFFGQVWDNLVIGGDPLVTECGNIEKWMIVKQAVGGAVAFFGINITAGALGPLGGLLIGVFLIIGIIMMIKLLKEFFKLFLEIVERYFVFFILLAFFPLTAATLSSNNTKRIFQTYLRMVYSQGFLLVINTVFMSIFFTILANGGWTVGLLNYLAAFAFLRVCQRIDAYMAQLGLNVVQTGASLFGAIGGAAMGFGSALRTIGAADRGRQNVGKGVQKLGNITNNSGISAMGATMGARISDILGGNLSSSQLSQTIMEGQSNVIAAGQNGMMVGNTTGISADSQDSLIEQLKMGGMSDEAAGIFANNAMNAGYDPSTFGSVKQLDADARNFAISDEDGNQVATMHGTSCDMLDKGEYDSAKNEVESSIGNGPNEAAIIDDEGRKAEAQTAEGFAQSYFKSSGIEQEMKQAHASDSTMSQEEIERVASGEANEAKNKTYSETMAESNWDANKTKASFVSQYGEEAFNTNFNKGFSQEAYANYNANKVYADTKAAKTIELQNHNKEVVTPTVEVKATPVYGKAGEFTVNYRYGNQNRSVTVLDPANHQKAQGDKMVTTRDGNKRRIIRDTQRANKIAKDDTIRTTSGKSMSKKPKR